MTEEERLLSAQVKKQKLQLKNRYVHNFSTIYWSRQSKTRTNDLY